MTVQEAIKQLKAMRSDYDDDMQRFPELVMQDVEALDMAIEALSCSEEPNMSDTIYRQDAIEELAKFVPYVIDDVSTESYTNGLTDAYNLICQLPSAQRKGKWIDDTCTECGYGVQPWNNTPFCPRCGSYNGGANMRGES